MMTIYIFDEKIFHPFPTIGFCMQLVICYYNQFSYKCWLQLIVTCNGIYTSDIEFQGPQHLP